MSESGSKYKRCIIKFHFDDADKEAIYYVPFDSSKDTVFHLNENFAVVCCVSKQAASVAISKLLKLFPELREVRLTAIFSFLNHLASFTQQFPPFPQHFHDI
jgi:hypothetical protein